MVKACVWVSNFRQEDVRDREFEGERGMERHIDKHAFRAGMAGQELSKMVDTARNVWAG